MKRVFKRLQNSREGATLITVVIATAFLIAVGVIILAASTKYLASVYVDRNSNENMYDAEGVLAEVRSGLLEYAGNAGEAAYRRIVENYEDNTITVALPSGGTETRTDSLKNIFARQYICGIIDQLECQPISPLIGVMHVLPYPDESALDPAHPEKAVLLERSQFPLRSLRQLTPYGYPDEPSKSDIPSVSLFASGGFTSGSFISGSFVSGEYVSGEGVDAAEGITFYEVYYSKLRGYYLVIKNLFIDHTDDSGYRSTIKTDVQINVPDYKFDGGDMPDEMNDYLSISDGDFKVSGVASSDNPASFYGNIYAGGYHDNQNSGETDRNGIYIDTSCGAHFNCEKLITRGDIVSCTGSNIGIFGPKDPSFTSPGAQLKDLKDTADGSVYAKNIILKPTTGGVSQDTEHGTHFKMAANAYIENDLDIQDSATTVELGGTYVGYSYNQDNSVSGLDKGKSEYSSAILVNGISTTIKTLGSDDPAIVSPDLGLKRLVLAGRAFVSRRKFSFASGGFTGINIADQSQPDIMMGESVSIRSNQMAYLVPERYVNVRHNPITSNDASDEAGIFTDPSSLVDKDKLMASSIGQYLDETNPVTGNYVQADIGNGAYVYLFLNFKDQHAANTYFQHFYNSEFVISKEGREEEEDSIPDDVSIGDLRDQALVYISDKDGMQLKLDRTLYLIAGNIIDNLRSDGGPSFQSATYFDESGKPSSSLLVEGQKIGQTYVSLQKSLTTNQSSNMRTNGDEDPLVKGNIIYPDNIPTAEDAFLLDDSSNGYAYSDGEASEKQTSEWPVDGKNALVMCKGNIKINSSFSGLVVAGGDVTVTENFKGLIISAGQVSVESNVTLESDPVLVRRLLSYAHSSELFHSVFVGMHDTDTQNSKVIDDCLNYVNWEKNSY